MTQSLKNASRAEVFDLAVRPQDDLFAYVNNNWINHNPIPADKSRWGTFDILQEDALQKLKAISEALQNQPNLTSGSPAQQVRDLYYTAMHIDELSEQHQKDIAAMCHQIDTINDTISLSAMVGALQEMGAGPVWNIWVDCDNNDSSKHVLHIVQSGLTLPSRDYYLDDTKAMQEVREKYKKHLDQVVKALPYVAGSKTEFTRAIMELETKIARASRTEAALRDVENNYHKMTPAEIKKTYPHIKWDAYAKGLGWQPNEQTSIDQPDFFESIDQLFVTVPLADWKLYLKWHFISKFYGQINESFAELSFELFGKTLGGAKKVMPRWRRAVVSIDRNIGQAAGLLYAAEHFPKSAKKQMLELVDRLKEAYKNRITRLEWMAESTKQEAYKKLANTNVLVGYPDEWRDFSGLVVTRQSHIANLMAAEKYNNAYFMRRIHEPVSREEWFMNPQTVNAYNDPNRVVICFPAAILMPPFFDPKAAAAVNFGGIGTVIGHELTHGFDDQGCKYDSTGNVREWQTKQDRENFTKRADIIVKQADAYEVLPGLTMQGNLVLGESIADLGGLEIAFEAFCLEKGGLDKVDNEDKRAFFIANAVVERSSIRDEKKRQFALVDPHPAATFRINGMVQHVDAFYQAFALKKGDALYRPDTQRARIW